MLPLSLPECCRDYAANEHSSARWKSSFSDESLADLLVEVNAEHDLIYNFPVYIWKTVGDSWNIALKNGYDAIVHLIDSINAVIEDRDISEVNIAQPIETYRTRRHEFLYECKKRGMFTDFTLGTVVNGKRDGAIIKSEDKPGLAARLRISRVQKIVPMMMKDDAGEALYCGQELRVVTRILLTPDLESPFDSKAEPPSGYETKLPSDLQTMTLEEMRLKLESLDGSAFDNTPTTSVEGPAPIAIPQPTRYGPWKDVANPCRSDAEDSPPGLTEASTIDSSVSSVHSAVQALPSKGNPEVFAEEEGDDSGYHSLRLVKSAHRSKTSILQTPTKCSTFMVTQSPDNEKPPLLRSIEAQFGKFLSVTNNLGSYLSVGKHSPSPLHSPLWV